MRHSRRLKPRVATHTHPPQNKTSHRAMMAPMNDRTATVAMAAIRAHRPKMTQHSSAITVLWPVSSLYPPRLSTTQPPKNTPAVGPVRDAMANAATTALGSACRNVTM